MTGSTTVDNTENVRKHPGNTKGVQLGGYKYNPSIVMSICNNLREGKGRVNSVVGCGVSFRQFCTWMYCKENFVERGTILNKAIIEYLKNNNK